VIAYAEYRFEESKRPDYRLADYFDYVSGTSTGGIIAAGIAMGMSVSEILAFYINNGAKMFDKASIFRRLQTKFESEPLALQLKEVFGDTTTLDCGGKPFIFVDGGVTMYNNPAFQMFLMATVDRFWIKAPRKNVAGKLAPTTC
jgi:patatin-like phospholipase/acyl hydrolase